MAQSLISRAVAVSLVAAATACSGADPTTVPQNPGEGHQEPAAFSVRESVQQIHVWHADPMTTLTLFASDGSVAEEATTDELGSYIFRELTPGSGYEVEGDFEGKTVRRGPFGVWTREGSLPAPEFYTDQKLEAGYSYITTRDGTKLAVYVYLPGPIEDGPYPTIVNYSGYDPGKPGAALDAGYCAVMGDKYPVLCDAPSHPSGMLGGLMKYASVGVNMRGTGCSGGAYDFFETMQVLDGYDAIEIIAAQDWVKHNHVGMAGLSYPGLSQLWVAASKPPSLAAITPLSVIADVDASTLIPGGIYNQGFALNWADNVLNGAKPYGKGWEQGLVDGGDTICEENQLLHGQQVDAIEKALRSPYYDADLYAPLKPSMFVDQIDVPVFMSGQWQDEQTGGHFAVLFDKFTGTDFVRFTAMNGVHMDGYTPHMLSEWKTFLDFFVDQTVPRQDNEIWPLSSLFFTDFFGAEVGLPEMRFEDFDADDFEGALESYKAEPIGRIAFEVGAPSSIDEKIVPGAPVPRFFVPFEEWPIATIGSGRRMYFGPSGTLSESTPGADGGASSFEVDTAIGLTKSVAGGINNIIPNWDWKVLPEDKALAFTSGAFEADIVMAGGASADLWIKSTADNADLEVNLTEVRPDGTEMYVQSGWLRASYRALRDDATPFRPVKSRLESEAKALTPGEWTEARVEIFSFAHVFRKGSRLRISVETPGGNRPEWTFILNEVPEGTRHSVGHAEGIASSVLLPVVYDVSIPADAAEPAPCPSLRAQPCRPFEEFVNSADE